MSNIQDFWWENLGFIPFLIYRIKPQLSHLISRILDIVWSLPNFYLIEQSPGCN